MSHFKQKETEAVGAGSIHSLDSIISNGPYKINCSRAAQVRVTSATCSNTQELPPVEMSASRQHFWRLPPGYSLCTKCLHRLVFASEGHRGKATAVALSGSATSASTAALSVSLQLPVLHQHRDSRICRVFPTAAPACSL